MKLKVKIDDVTFMVGVPNKKQKISWLIERAASCYKEATSNTVKLTLKTADDCLLSSDDVISDVLTSGDVVVGVVKSRDRKSLIECYKASCDQLNIAPIKNIENACSSCDIHNTMELSNFPYSYQHHLKPLLKVIGQSQLKELRLSSARLGYAGVTCLCESMTSSPFRYENPVTRVKLKVLEMKCCDLDGSCVDVLAAAGDGGGQDFVSDLTTLDVSHNNLSEGHGLINLLSSCLKLREVNISYCDLNAQIVGDLQLVFRDMKDLEVLDISNNNFEVEDLHQLLSSLQLNNSSMMKYLNLSNIVSTGEDDFIETLSNNLQKMRLTTLDLTYNNLNETQIESIRTNTHLKTIPSLLL